MQEKAHPRLILLRRFIALLLLGAAHQLLQPGEALLPYAVCALLLLLSLTFVPLKWFRYITLFGGVGFTLTSLLLTGGGISLIPGTFLVGAALRSPKTPETAAPVTALNTFHKWQFVCAFIGTLISGITVWLSFTAENFYRSEIFMATSGLIMMATYVLLVVLLAHSKIGDTVHKIFTPLGKMALTNYITATLLMVVAKVIAAQTGMIWDSSYKAWITMTVICLLILILQWIFSTLWLIKFKQGPLDNLWRKVTYWQR